MMKHIIVVSILGIAFYLFWKLTGMEGLISGATASVLFELFLINEKLDKLNKK